LDMCPESEIGNIFVRISLSLRIWLIRNLSILLLVIAATIPSAMAGKHPVKLDKNVDGSQCLECHKEKAGGKAVHSAIATGCLSCHQVRASNDVTRVNLKTVTPVKLCIQCHSDKDADEIKGRVHLPAVRDCLKCHNPHSSDNKDHLQKPVSGAGKDENLCLTCHNVGTEVEKGGSRHAALNMGCEICHTVHKTGERGKREFDFQLKKDSPALCMDCHDTKNPKLVETHRGQPFVAAGCLTCHDSHQSTRPNLILAFVHSPLKAGKASCAICHQPPEEGRVVLKKASPKELCLTCHPKKADQIRNAKVPHAGAASDCTECHNSHASSQPGLPKPDAVNACLRCHSDQAKQYNKKYLHQPAFGLGCSTCHEPHGGENDHLLRTKTVNSLCLECHAPDPKLVPVKDAHTVAIFNGRVKLPEGYISTVPAVAIKYGLGHPIQRHPVADQMDPEDVTKVRYAINCCSCHQPHASEERNLLVKDQANNIKFCAGCHESMGK
jgi:predicted CXXCH cytochrome family protein